MSLIRIDQISEIVIANPQNKELLQYQSSDGTWVNSNELPQKVTNVENQVNLNTASISSTQTDVSTLQTFVSALSSDLDTVTSDLADEVTARAALDQRVVALENADTNQDLTELQTELQNEITARQNADSALDTRLDSLELDPVTKTEVTNSLLLKADLSYVNDEIARATAREQELQDLIDAIEGVNDVQAFQAQVDKIETALGASYTNNVYQPDLTANYIDEATSVQNAAKLLDVIVHGLSLSKASVVDLTNETNARIQSDNELRSSIESNDSDILALQNADTNINNSLSALDVRVTDLESGADLEQAVQDLQAEIALKATITSVTAVSDRVQLLENDHVTLEDFNLLSNQVEDKANQLDLSSEEQARIAGDSALDSRLDVLEANDATVGSVLNAIKVSKDYTDLETAARLAADTLLSNRITTLEESTPSDTNFEALSNRVTAVETDIDQLQTDLLNYTTTDALNLLLNDKANATALTEEINNRQESDETLQSNIDVVSNNLSQEILDRAAADLTLQTNIDSVVDDLAQEILDRSSADNTLQNNINTVSNNLATQTTNLTNLENRVETLENDTYSMSEVDALLLPKATTVDLQAEVTRAQQAEASLQQSIDTIMTGSNVDLDTFGELITLINSIDTENSDALGAEITARINADQQLQTNIDTLSNQTTISLDALDVRLDTIEGSGAGSLAKTLQDAKDYTDLQLTTESQTRFTADQNLQAGIDGLLSDIADLELLIDNEESARIAADTTITNELNLKATITSVTLVSDDLNDLSQSVDAIDTRLNTAEITIAIKANQDDLTFETQARVEGDQALQTNIDAIELDVSTLQTQVGNTESLIHSTVSTMFDDGLHTGISVSIVNNAISLTSNLRTVNDINPVNGNVSLTTSNIPEQTNQYHTPERVRTSISVSGDLEYDQENGIISFTNPWVQTDDVLEFNGYVKIQGHLVEQFDMGSLSNDVEYTLDGGSVASISHTLTDLGTLHYRRLF